MFFILSKILSFVTNPLVMVTVCLVTSILTKRKRLRRMSFGVGLSLLLFFSNEFIANEVMQAWEVEATPYASITQHYAWGVVLTGVMNNDLLPDDRVYFQHGADRVVHTVDLYKRGIIQKILISGGTGRVITEGRREADDFYKAMILMGVPDSVMTIENNSRNTYESAINVKPLLTSTDTVLLITSAFHMRRSLACFKKAEIPVTAFSTDFYTHPRFFTPDVLFIPKVGAIEIWQKLFKEWIGMLAYRISGYI